MSGGVLDRIEVPKGWRIRRLQATLERRRTTGRPDLEPLSVFLEAGVVPRSARNDNHNQLGADLARYLVVEHGDLVFNRLRTWQGGLGTSQYVGIVSPAYIVCRPRRDVEPRFLHYLLRSTPYLAELSRISKWMPPAQFDILWADLRELPLLLPSVREQDRIVRFLDAEACRVDRLTEKRQRMTSLLSQRRTAVMHEGVSGLLTSTQPRVVSRVPWLSARPADWRDVKLTLVAGLGSGHTPSRGHPEWWEEATIPWITTGEVVQMRSDRIEHLYETREKVSELGLANSAAVLRPAGTVVLCRTASAGYSAIMGKDMATSQDFATWICGPLLRPRFLLLCLRVMRPDLLGRLAMGSTHKTIYMPDIEAIRIPLPPVGEQDAIVEEVHRRLRSIDRVIGVLSRQVVLLKERRQALITAAVTGELDVTKGAA